MVCTQHRHTAADEPSPPPPSTIITEIDLQQLQQAEAVWPQQLQQAAAVWPVRTTAAVEAASSASRIEEATPVSVGGVYPAERRCVYTWQGIPRPPIGGRARPGPPGRPTRGPGRPAPGRRGDRPGCNAITVESNSRQRNTEWS